MLVLKDRKTEAERTGLTSLLKRGEVVALLRASEVAISATNQRLLACLQTSQEKEGAALMEIFADLASRYTLLNKDDHFM